jgi:hypothetical protein
MTSRSAYGLDSQPVDDELWARRGLCRDGDLWFARDAETRGLARHICLRHCPVLEQCMARMERRAKRGVTPNSTVEAGVSWNQQSRVSSSQPIARKCDLHCREMTAEELSQAERDIAAYALKHGARVQRAPARKGAVKAHAGKIEELARQHVTDAEIARQLGLDSKAGVGKVRRAAGLVRRKGWHEAPEVRNP